MPDEHGRKIKCCWMQERAFDRVSSSGAVAWLPHIHASSCSSHVWGLSDDLTGVLLALLSPPAEGVLYWCILVGDMYESPVYSPRKGSFVCYYGRSSTIGKKNYRIFPVKWHVSVFLALGWKIRSSRSSLALYQVQRYPKIHETLPQFELSIWNGKWKSQDRYW